MDKFEQGWQTQVWGETLGETYAPPDPSEFQRVVARVVRKWEGMFGM